MPIINTPSPNHDSRGGQAVDMLVLHYTGMPTSEAALARLTDPAQSHRVSAHYLVAEDGAVHRLVEEGERAWHAGISAWRGWTNINARSIGIEIANPGHDGGLPPFPPVQMQAVARLSKEIIGRHHIPARNVVAHSDIAPARKMDPGERFDWKWLAEQGVGLWVDGKGLGIEDWGLGKELVPNAQSLVPLQRYGYDIANLPAAVTAFQRHFRPALLTGEWDDECAVLLAALLEAAGPAI